MLLMDIVTFDSNENVNNSQKINNNFFDYIYLNTGDKLLKFKITIDNYIHLVNVIENYILNMKVDDFSVVDEKQLENMETLPKHFFPYIGKYVDAGDIRKTNHYYVPKTTTLLDLFVDLYNKTRNSKELTLSSFDLNNFTDIIKKAKDYNDVRAIDQLLSYITVELVDEYEFNGEVITLMLPVIRKATGKSILDEVINRISFIEDTSKRNVDDITFLNLEDRFIEATKEKRQKVK